MQAGFQGNYGQLSGISCLMTGWCDRLQPVMNRRMILIILFLLVLLKAVAVSFITSITFADSSLPKNNEQPVGEPGEQVYVILEKNNGYLDTFDQGYFARAGTSGTGTGPFVGKGFEFSKGECKGPDDDMVVEGHWRSHTLGCSRQLLETDWCARKISDPSIRYTLHFLSWTVGPEGKGQRCQGLCKANRNQTAYFRTRVR